MDFRKGLEKIVEIFETESIGYMVVGGFALSYYNRFRFTADIDCVIQVYPHHVEQIIKYFPDWLHSLEFFKDSALRGRLFNITDFETGVKYDFMPYIDSDYNYVAFERRRKVDFMDISCFIATPEDLVIAKLKWYEMSESAKQLEDIKFLLTLSELDFQYLEGWVNRLNIRRYGLF